MTAHQQQVAYDTRRITTRAANGAESEQLLFVASKRLVAEEVVELVFRGGAGAALPTWTPGSHVDVLVGAADSVTRQYSLCGPLLDPHHYRIAVLLEPDGRGGSLAVHRDVAVGDLLRVRGPRNHFRLDPADRYLFVAGGIGITPLLPMIEQLHTAGTDWRLLYGGRSRSSMAYLDELAGYRDRVWVHPQDEAGLLPLDEFFGEPIAGTVIYCCGPAGLLAAAEERARPWPARTLRVERFTPVEQPGAEQNRAIEVTLARTGRTLTVPPGTSILDAVERAGVNVLASCREGTCGTCETAILDGLAEHRDSVLSAEDREEQDAMMICVSRANTDQLTLDL